MGKQSFKYIGLCMGIYLCLSAIEIFLCKPLVDFIGTGFWTHMLVYSCLLLIANPIATYFIIKRFFKFEPEIIVANNRK